MPISGYDVNYNDETVFYIKTTIKYKVCHQGYALHTCTLGNLVAISVWNIWERLVFLDINNDIVEMDGSSEYCQNTLSDLGHFPIQTREKTIAYSDNMEAMRVIIGNVCLRKKILLTLTSVTTLMSSQISLSSCCSSNCVNVLHCTSLHSMRETNNLE